LSSSRPKLREKRIVQWALTYLGVAWLAYQVVDSMAEPWGIPSAVLRGVTVLLATGFVWTLVLSWYHGERGQQRVTAVEFLLLTFVGAAGASGAYVAAKNTPDSGAGERPAASTVRENAVAVLPFLDLSPAGDHGYFADGVAEEIISALTRDGRVRVAARTSSFLMRDQPASVVGQQLSVRAVLEGSVRRDGGTVRITARLVDASDDFEIWSQAFDRPMEGVLGIQAEIASTVVAQLTGADHTPDVVASIDPVAYERYLQGRFYWNRRTERDLLLARDLFEGAIEAAPTYARAVAGLADTYAILGFYQWLPPGQAFPAATRYAREALTLDPGFAEPLATIAYARTYHDWDWEGAEAAFISALDLNDQYPVAHQWYGNLLTVLGRPEEAVAQLMRALELDPLSLIARAALPWAYHYGGNFERALALFDQVIAIDADFLQAHSWRGLSLVEVGRYEEAIASFERAVELSDSSATALAGLAYGYARSGDAGSAEEILDGLTRPDAPIVAPAYEIAKVYLGLGRLEEAVRWLERAYDERANQLALIGVDPAVDPYRDDPRIAALIGRLGLDGSA
jgi:TolB-like protein/tetratricopeptide (TPR) repeat protein